MLSVSDYLQKIISYQKLDLMASGLEFWRTRRKLRTKLLFVFKADILNAYPVVAWHFGGRYSRRRFFDETLVRYGLMEDTDISKQVLNVGYKIYYHASAMLVHNESPKNRLNYRQWAKMTVVNYEYLFRKSWGKDKYGFLKVMSRQLQECCLSENQSLCVNKSSKAGFFKPEILVIITSRQKTIYFEKALYR